MAEARAIVIGGGLAGCAAATVLAERGAEVTLLEKETFLGGRAGAWPDRLRDGTPFQMERGFHAFFRQYYALRDLMKRVDPALSMLRPLEDYPLLGPGGWRESFSGLPRRVPLNLIALVARTPSLHVRDLARIDLRRALEMLAFDPARTYERWDGTTAKAYLDGLGFPPRARQMLFEVFAHSFFNPEDDYSAAELLAMFHFYFLGNREGLVFDVMREPFSLAFWEPLRRWLQARGVEIRVGTEARAIRREGTRFAIELARGPALRADACVLAVTVPALRSIIDRSPSLGDLAWRERIASLEVTRPFAVWRLWLDRPMRADRAPFAGTSGVGVLDNVSIYEKLEGESAAWARAHGGSVVELHGYGLDPGADERAIREQLRAGWIALYPEAASAQVIEDRFLLRRDCPAFAPGSHALRPGVETGVRGLALAGDFVRTPHASALMERATWTGFRAGSAIATALGKPGREAVSRTVPRRGALAPFVRA